jgi:hypothetical protein
VTADRAYSRPTDRLGFQSDRPATGVNPSTLVDPPRPLGHLAPIRPNYIDHRLWQAAYAYPPISPRFARVVVHCGRALIDRPERGVEAAVPREALLQSQARCRDLPTAPTPGPLIGSDSRATGRRLGQPFNVGRSTAPAWAPCPDSPQLNRPSFMAGRLRISVYIAAIRSCSRPLWTRVDRPPRMGR